MVIDDYQLVNEYGSTQPVRTAAPLVSSPYVFSAGLRSGDILVPSQTLQAAVQEVCMAVLDSVGKRHVILFFRTSQDF